MWREKLITNNPFIQMLIEGSLENVTMAYYLCKGKYNDLKKKKNAFFRILEDCVPTKLQKTAVSTAATIKSSIKVIVRMLRA